MDGLHFIKETVFSPPADWNSEIAKLFPQQTLLVSTRNSSMENPPA